MKHSRNGIAFLWFFGFMPPPMGQATVIDEEKLSSFGEDPRLAGQCPLGFDTVFRLCRASLRSEVSEVIRHELSSVNTTDLETCMRVELGLR